MTTITNIYISKMNSINYLEFNTTDDTVVVLVEFVRVFGVIDKRSPWYVETL